MFGDFLLVVPAVGDFLVISKKSPTLNSDHQEITNIFSDFLVITKKSLKMLVISW